MLKLVMHHCEMSDPVRQRVVGAVSMILAEDESWQGDLKRFLVEEIIPSARHGKIAFFLNFDSIPVGFVTWAHLARETEQRILQSMDAWLHLSEWNEGETFWVRSMHLPTGLRREGLRLCLDRLFPDEQTVRLLQPRRGQVSVFELDRPVIERMSRLI
jgi:hemolysin-activating ACP:hemolysin acyltransferase